MEREMRKAILINPKYHTCGDILYVWYERDGHIMCSWTPYAGFLKPFVLEITDVEFVKEEKQSDN
jgi:hypothetical protein